MSWGNILNDQSKLRPGKCSENSRNAGAAGFSENWRNKRRKANSHMLLYLMQHNFDLSKRWIAWRLKSFSWKHLDSAAKFTTQGSKAETANLLAASETCTELNTLGLGEMDWLHLFNSHDPMLLHTWRQRMLRSKYPELYTKWREDPTNFHVNGIYPIRELWGTARQVWEEILLTPVWTFWYP